MSVDFRSAVFHLCRKLTTNKEALFIQKTIHDISVVITTENEDPKVWKRPPHGDLAQIAAHNRLQFLGYLLADESVEDINKTPPFQATHLDNSERKVIERAHVTLQLFVSECTEDLKAKYPKAYLLIEPYGLFRKPQISSDAEPFLNSNDIKECVNAFKNGKLYKKLIENDAFQILENAGENMIKQLCVIQQKQFTDDFSVTTKETTDYVHRIQSGVEFNVPDILMTYSIFSYALRRSLVIATQMLFEAIIGHDMLVMNNDNIINIEGAKSDTVYEKYIILIQDALWGRTGGDVGSIVLLSCSPSENYHIKEFGLVFALTVSFIGEFGDSSKLTIATVDEELNEIHLLTDFILSTKIGSIPVKQQSR